MGVVGCSLAFGLVTGCGKDNNPVNPPETPIVNQFPDTYLTDIPFDPFETINYDDVNFGWIGFDPDGEIELYKYKLSPLMNDYEVTPNTFKSFSDLGNGDYDFYVTAMDDSGAWDPTPAEISFTVYKEYTMTFQPGPEGIDSYVWGDWVNGNPLEWCDYNYGGSDSLMIAYFDVEGNNNVYYIRSFLKFDELSNIPPNADISNAKFSLYKTNISGFGEVQVSKVNNYWGEYFVTWNNQPSCFNSVEAVEFIPNGDIRHYWDLTDYAQSVVNGEYSNYGLGIKFVDESNGSHIIVFGSSDHPDPSKRPKLELVYTIDQ